MNVSNSIRLIGVLDRNPLYVTTENGADLTRFELVTLRQASNSSLQQLETNHDRHQCVAWGPNALQLHEHLVVGSRVAIQGQLLYSSYVTSAGMSRVVAEVEVNGFTFLGDVGHQKKGRKHKVQLQAK